MSGNNAKGVAEKVRVGDVRTVARLLRDIDNGVSSVREVLKELYPYTGKAYVVGITGSPGVGKSTLVDQLVTHLRRKNKTVGVLAIDPSSPFSGGAILGDRVRMQRHSLDQGVFIRSLATRGHFGGLTESTRSAMDVLDAMGKDYVLVETVGVGQDEVDIVKTAYTTVVALSPGMGDGIQAIKAGILEVGDIFVINKADRDGTDKTFSDLRLMINMDESKYLNGRWKPPILKTQAILGEGIEELLEEIEAHRKYGIERSGGGEFTKRKDAIHEELADMVKGRLLKEVFQRLIKTGEFQRAVESIARKDMDPYTACDNLISSELGES